MRSKSVLRVGRYATAAIVGSTVVDKAVLSVEVIAIDAARAARVSSIVVDAGVVALHTTGTPGDAVGNCGCCHHCFNN